MFNSSVSQLAQGKWRGIIPRYGIEANLLDGKHHPCPICGGKDRFRFTDHEGLGYWVCNQCQPKPNDGISLLMAVTGRAFKDLAGEVEEMCGKVKPEPIAPKKDPRPLLNYISKHAKRLTGGDPASKYLASRGIYATKDCHLRWLESFDYIENGETIGRYPVMVGRVSNLSMQRETYHITYLTADGEKANVQAVKKVMSPINTVSGCGIWLGSGDDHLAIGEGIETTLAWCNRHRKGLATLTANGMKSIKILEKYRNITILADNDKSFTGQAAAYHLAQRLTTEGRNVDVFVSPEEGQDYLDYVQKA